ncbi:MAG: Nramp family divalent metal transporter [Terrisporobacter sp.]|uniref:Nramp family divalent metal transporter n=1 Tax=Terrisporobacter sp. TaxID=1965305 RepID=UPI002FC5D68E
MEALKNNLINKNEKRESKFKERLRNIGPGALIAAGFIGPGTITTCTKSGASSGYTLLWAMLFSTVATIIFQEMAARLGIITQMGLGENIRSKISNKFLRSTAVVIVIVAIFIGNIAYETGNLVGGSMGLSTLIPQVPNTVWAPLLGVVAFSLLWSGNYKRIEKILIGLVLVMSVTFFTTAIVSKPDLGAIIKGLFIPQAGENDWLTIVGLIGTTVVPYNLFLHASSVSERWTKKEDLKNARIDTVISIGLGGLISMAVIISASASFHGTEVVIDSGAVMAQQLEPLLGSWAKWFFGIGIFAAGFTSAITAPLSAAFATTGALGYKKDMKSMRFKTVWMIVLGVGIVLSAIGMSSSPTELILVAQAANAIILPIIAIFLIYVLNHKDLGKYKNKLWNNILGVFILCVTVAISYRSLLSFVETIKGLFI